MKSNAEAEDKKMHSAEVQQSIPPSFLKTAEMPSQ